MPTTNVTTKIGQFYQPSSSALFAAVSADMIYVNGVPITGLTGSGGGGTSTATDIAITFVGISGTTVSVDTITNSVTINAGGSAVTGGGGSVTASGGSNVIQWLGL